MNALDRYFSVLFDCDGVLLDTTEAKLQAFRDALAGEPADRIEAFITYQRANWGVSRYVSLRRFYAEMFPVDDAEEKAVAAIGRFAAGSRKALQTCPEIPGMRTFLDTLRRRACPSFVVTGGDQAEVRDVFIARGLSPYFSAILGSPRAKADNVADIVQSGAVRLPAILFGDAQADYDAAASSGIDFALVKCRSDWRQGEAFCRAAGHMTINDFTDFFPLA